MELQIVLLMEELFLIGSHCMMFFNYFSFTQLLFDFIFKYMNAYLNMVSLLDVTRFYLHTLFYNLFDMRKLLISIFYFSWINTKISCYFYFIFSFWRFIQKVKTGFCTLYGHLWIPTKHTSFSFFFCEVSDFVILCSWKCSERDIVGGCYRISYFRYFWYV